MLELERMEQVIPSGGPHDDGGLDDRIQALCAEGDQLRERFHQDLGADRFHGFVAADYGVVFRALQKLQHRAISFLEWGSGTGVITIMADLLGFEAYGIELDEQLVDVSHALADKYSSAARFAAGSFIPAEYQWNPIAGDENFRTVLEVAPGYEELDMELCDFDLVYAYPWPDEEPLFHDIMRQCGCPSSLWLTFGTFEGIRLQRNQHEVCDE